MYVMRSDFIHPTSEPIQYVRLRHGLWQTMCGLQMWECTKRHARGHLVQEFDPPIIANDHNTRIDVIADVDLACNIRDQCEVIGPLPLVVVCVTL